MSKSTKEPNVAPVSVHMSMIQATLAQIEKALDKLEEFMGPEDAEIVRPLFTAWKANPRGAVSNEAIEGEVVAIEGEVVDRSETMRLVIGAVFRSIDCLGLASRGCEWSSTAIADDEGAELLTIAWGLIASAEFERGNALGLNRGNNLKESDLTVAMKSAIREKQQTAAKSERPLSREGHSHDRKEVENYLVRQRSQKIERADAMKNASARFHISVQHARKIATTIGWKRNST